MNITRFAQSCILLETNNKRILIDPGVIQYEKSFPDNEWKDIDIILVTHKHGDHCNVPAIIEMIKDSKSRFYTSSEVTDAHPELKELITKVVKEGDTIEEDNIRIEVTKAVHGYTPLLRGEKEINENIGFIVDDKDKRAYATSDTICFKNDYRCDILFIPISAHGLVMTPFEAALFAKATEAKLVIPIHLDNPSYPPDIEAFKKECEKNELNFKFLEIKNSIEF